MLRSGTIMNIRQKAQAGISAYSIGKEMGLSKNSARKHIARPIGVPLRTVVPSKHDEYKPYLIVRSSHSTFCHCRPRTSPRRIPMTRPSITGINNSLSSQYFKSAWA